MPQLFETMVRSLGPCYAIAVIRFSGMPHRPKPPAQIVAPSLISLVASAAESNILVAKYLAERVEYCERVSCLKSKDFEELNIIFI